MTKDIILTISGFHVTEGESDDSVEVMSPGQYYFKNGKHYVVYDEVMEGIDGVVKSTLKFTEDQVELFRSGAASTRMVFQKQQEHMAVYQTPMGPLSISLYTDDIISDIREEQMNLEIYYSLKTDGIVLTESKVKLNICPKELKEF